jgi:predicted  nucleic acid-binding Zn-ribbon protein
MSLECLWTLQEIDQKLIKVAKESKQRELVLALNNAYSQIQETEVFLEQLNKEITGLEQKAEEYEKMLKELDKEKTHFEERLYSGQANSPKEMEGLGNKIAQLESKISNLEEKTLAIMDVIEDKVHIVNKRKAELNKLKKDYQKGYKKYQFTKEKLEQERILLETQRKEKIALITEELLKKYNQLQEKFKFKGVALIESGRCSGCKIDISRIHLKAIQQGQSEVYCEHCRRLIVGEIQKLSR